MVTVGYGDISPNTREEKMVTIFLTIISCGVFAFAVNTIDVIFREIQEKQATIKKQKFQVSQYMQKRQISYANQMKVIKILEFLDKEQEEENIEGLEILKQISKSISENVFREYYGQVLKKCKIIQNGQYSNDLLDTLVLKMNECTFSPQTILYHQGQPDSRFFILIEGQLEIFYKSKNKDNQEYETIIKVIKGQQDIFHKEFYTQQPYKYSVRCLSICRLVYIERQDFLNSLKFNSNDFQKFNFQKETYLYNKNYFNICYKCNSTQHQQQNCPYMHYYPNIFKLIHQNNQSEISTKRIRYYRRGYFLNEYQLKFCPLQDIEYQREALIKIRCDIISDEVQQEVEYDLNHTDIEFYYCYPKIQFKPGVGYFCENDFENDPEDEQFFKEYYELYPQYLLEIDSTYQQEITSGIDEDEEKDYQSYSEVNQNEEETSYIYTNTNTNTHNNKYYQNQNSKISTNTYQQNYNQQLRRSSKSLLKKDTLQSMIHSEQNIENVDKYKTPNLKKKALDQDQSQELQNFSNKINVNMLNQPINRSRFSKSPTHKQNNHNSNLFESNNIMHLSGNSPSVQKMKQSLSQFGDDNKSDYYANNDYDRSKTSVNNNRMLLPQQSTISQRTYILPSNRLQVEDESHLQQQLLSEELNNPQIQRIQNRIQRNQSKRLSQQIQSYKDIKEMKSLVSMNTIGQQNKNYFNQLSKQVTQNQQPTSLTMQQSKNFDNMSLYSKKSILKKKQQANTQSELYTQFLKKIMVKIDSEIKEETMKQKRLQTIDQETSYQGTMNTYAPTNIQLTRVETGVSQRKQYYKKFSTVNTQRSLKSMKSYQSYGRLVTIYAQNGENNYYNDIYGPNHNIQGNHLRYNKQSNYKKLKFIKNGIDIDRIQEYNIFFPKFNYQKILDKYDILRLTNLIKNYPSFMEQQLKINNVLKLNQDKINNVNLMQKSLGFKTQTLHTIQQQQTVRTAPVVKRKISEFTKTSENKDEDDEQQQQNKIE